MLSGHRLRPSWYEGGSEMKSIINYTNLLKSFFAQKQILSDEVETRAKLGAHNLLIGGVNTTSGNVTGITRNADGSITIEPRSELGVGELYFSVRGSKDLFLPNGEYVLTGGISSNISLRIGYSSKTNGNYTDYGHDRGDGLTFTVDGCYQRDDGAYITSNLEVLDNTEVSSTLTLYPLLRLASDSDPTYQPYAMTNRELTQEIDKRIESVVSSLSFSVAAGEMYLAYTQGGADNSYSYIWLVIANNNGAIRIIPVREGTQQSISISESNNVVTLNCSSTTLIMGYTKI